MLGVDFAEPAENVDVVGTVYELHCLEDVAREEGEGHDEEDAKPEERRREGITLVAAREGRVVRTYTRMRAKVGRTIQPRR